MLSSAVPTKFPIPWANGAGGGFIRPIPVASQIGITPGAASLTDGFPPLTFDPSGSGGIAPFGQDANGIFNQITKWSQWQAAGGPIIYDSGFSAAIGGYPKGAMLMSSVTPGLVWVSTAENNGTDPDGGSPANWTTLAGASLAGDVTGPAGANVIANDVITAAMMQAHIVGGGQIISAPAAGVFGALAAGNGAWLSASQTLSALGGFSVATDSNSDTVEYTLTMFGFILKFGTTTRHITAEGSQSITLPTGFPNNVFATWGNAYNNVASALEDLWVQTTNGSTPSILEFFCQGTSSTPGHIDGITWGAFGN
jgi:hypothetical protein